MFQKKNNEKDIALVLAWQEGNSEAIEELLSKYMPLIMKASINSYATCDFEDMRQELIAAFLESTIHYIPVENISFASYIKKKIYWARHDILRQLRYKDSHELLNIADQKEPTYEIDWTSNQSDDINKIIEILPLTDNQKRVFALWIQGNTNLQIMNLTGMSQQSVSKVLRVAKLKIHKKQHVILEKLRKSSISLH